MHHLDVIDSGNVVRLPSELRVVPSMALLGALEPDLHEVMVAAGILGLEMPAPDLCERVDEETARYIAEQVLPLTPYERGRALEGLLGPVLMAAVEACGSAVASARRSAGAARDVQQAHAAGGQWLGPLEEAAAALLREAGRALIEAHCRCLEARGVSRAVCLARRGEAWWPQEPAGLPGWRTEEGAAREA